MTAPQKQTGYQFFQVETSEEQRLYCAIVRDVYGVNENEVDHPGERRFLLMSQGRPAAVAAVVVENPRERPLMGTIRNLCAGQGPVRTVMLEKLEAYVQENHLGGLRVVADSKDMGWFSKQGYETVETPRGLVVHDTVMAKVFEVSGVRPTAQPRPFRPSCS